MGVDWPVSWLFIVWIVELPLFGRVDPFTPEGLERFIDVRAALGMSTILMMTIAFLSIALVLALYRALRVSNLAFALFGSVLGIIGYIATALGDASTFFAFAPISDLNQAPAATPETQATVVLLWQATQGITHTFFFVGSLFMVTCFIVLGMAMLRAPDIGRRLGGGEHCPRGARTRGRGCKSLVKVGDWGEGENVDASPSAVAM